MKTLRSQFLARNIWKDGKVSSSHLKNLYELQKKWLVKPVKFLSHKHVYSNNIEKMNVRRAVEVFFPDVTSALSNMKNQAGNCSDASFASAGPSIQFMENVYGWFTLHDTATRHSTFIRTSRSRGTMMTLKILVSGGWRELCCCT